MSRSRPIGAHAGGKGDGQIGIKEEAGTGNRMRVSKAS